MLELRTRLLSESKFAVDQCQGGTPSASHGVLLDEVAHDRCEFLEAALLAAQGKHLQSKDASGIFRCLQALSKSESFLGQAFAVGEVPLHQGPHGPQPCTEAKMEWLLLLFCQVEVRVNRCVGGWHISKLE
jgi:hypothetical protein